MIDLKTLKQLIRLMADQDLTEMDLEDEKGEKVRLRRRGGVPEVQYVTAQPQPTMPAGQAHGGNAAAVPAAPAAASGGGGAPASEGTSGATAGGTSGGLTIKSPMVGTYYASPTPDAKPFVAAGDRVDADTVVCIIEAMKVFNEIKAEVAGTIERVLVENGQSVEFGQPMFQVKPD